MSVPKLLGRENYDEWAFAVENVFVIEGLDKCIDGSEKDTSRIANAKAKLILTIDPSLFPHGKDSKTAEEVWTRLRKLYDDSGFMRKIGLLRTLISARLDNHVNMESHINQIIETSQKLRRTGFAIDEIWVGSLLLAGLPEKFAPMIMAIENSGLEVTTDSIKTKLLDMQTDGDTNGSNGAFAVNRKFGYRKQPKESAVKKQHKERSQNRNDKFTREIADQHNSNKKDLSNIICFRCKKNGHYMSRCPNRVDGGFSAVFTTGDFNVTDWYVDSGASFHLTSNKQWMINFRNPDLKNVTVANKAKLGVECAGDVKIQTFTDKKQDILLQGVQYVPGLTTNLYLCRN